MFSPPSKQICLYPTLPLPYYVPVSTTYFGSHVTRLAPAAPYNKKFNPQQFRRHRNEAQLSTRSVVQALKQDPTSYLGIYCKLLEHGCRSIVTNTLSFECSVCFASVPAGAGVVLRNCLHTFCRRCLEQTIRHSAEAQVRCPHATASFSCSARLLTREIRNLASEKDYEKYLAKLLAIAGQRNPNAYHCRAPDCPGWWIRDDDALEKYQRCPLCHKKNCMACGVSEMFYAPLSLI